MIIGVIGLILGFLGLFFLGLPLGIVGVLFGACGLVYGRREGRELVCLLSVVLGALDVIAVLWLSMV